MAELIWKGKEATLNPRSNGLTDYQTTIPPLNRHFHTIEIFNGQHHHPEEIPQLNHRWYNRLIAGEKSTVLPALLPEFAGQVDLIYIDPPFITCLDFKSGTELPYSDKCPTSWVPYLHVLDQHFVLFL